MHYRVVFQVAATYIGAVMGAGFASGQEIQQFFASFGKLGLSGIIVSALLFSCLGWIMLDLQERWKVNSYPEFFRFLLGPKWGKHVDSLISVLLFIGMIAMLSGSGALFIEYFGLSKWIGIGLTGLVISVALWFKGEGVLWINTVLIPLKFLFCLGIGFTAIFLGVSGESEGIKILPNPLVRNWLFSAVLYVSFNLTLAMVVFASLGKVVQRPGARLGAILGGVALGTFAMVIGASLLRFPEVTGMEIPMVAVAGKLGDWPSFLYVMVLWLAMLTAAIGDGFSLVSRIVETKKFSYSIATAVLLSFVIPLAGIRFSDIVKIVYPLFGYLGLLFLPTLIYKWKRN